MVPRRLSWCGTLTVPGWNCLLIIIKLSVFILFKYITNSKFRICVKELFVQQFDPLDVSYAVLAGKSFFKIILLKVILKFQLTTMSMALLATTKPNEKSNTYNWNTNTKQGQSALKMKPVIKTKTMTTTENSEPNKTKRTASNNICEQQQHQQQ